MGTYEITDDDMMGQMHDALGGIFTSSSRSSQKRGRPEELSQEAWEALERLQKAMSLLTALSLRHESQLQAQASTDQFLMFFQMNQQGILPSILNHTTSWKKEMEQNKAKKPLRVVLFQLVCQTVLDRMLATAKLSQSSQEWDQAVKSQLITSEGKWPYLQWCSDSKCLKQTNKPAIDMVKMQKTLEDLVEAAQADHHILRFKSLKNTSTEIKHQQICPFLLHISIRESSIWETLNLLSHNSIWLVIQARVRPHSQRENPLATSLAKSSKQDVRMSSGRSSKRK